MTLKLILLTLVYTAPYFSEGQSPCNTANELQLNRTSSFISTNNAGRLEICYCPSNGGNCTWATISAGSLTTPWSWKNVQVACRDLSIGTGLGNPILQSTVRPADVASVSISIYPSTFSCDGTETKLSDCIILSIPTDSNVHSADVFINCLSTTPSRSLRLTGSTTRHQGVLEIYVSGIWRTFCPTSFDTVDANVACQTLGYSSGTVRLFPNTGYKGTVISLSPTITGVSCGTVTNFDSCFYQLGGSCSSSNLAGVTCTASSSATGTVRLFSVSTSSTYDRVEILYAGRWGTVCDNQWSITDGRVACRGLGHDVDDTTVPTSFTPPSSSERPIWVSGYTCSGSESRLSTCTNTYPIGYAPSCSHSRDAGLSCSQDSGKGLSSGAIAGIVVGILIVLFIVVPLVYAYGNDLRKKGRIRGWWSRQRSRARTWTEGVRFRRDATTRENNLAALELELSNTNTSTQETPRGTSSQRLSSSSDSSTSGPTTPVTNNEPDETNTLQNTELTKAPPPSYNEAIHLKHVQPPPPQYISQEPEEKLPYPVSPYPSDPAYPPQPPPIGFDNQGYPPPTQYPPLDHGGMRLPSSTGSINGERDLPSSSSDLPYPD